MPIYPENFVSNSLSGTILVTNGFANISLPTNPFALEGDKNFVIKLRKGGVNGLVIATSPTITVRDTSQLVSLTANISTVAEGNAVVFTLVTANAPDNSNVFYSVFPVTANVNTADFSSANVGKATIVGNQATFILVANADNSLVSEAGETFKIQLRENSITGNVIFTTSNVIISDVSKRTNVYSFVESSSSIVEGSTVTFTIFAHNLPAGNLLYYYTTGNAGISGSNTGSIAINNTSNTVTITTSASVPANQTRAFSLVLSESSLGTAVATSNAITVVDSAGAYLNATGGTVSTIDGYRVHTFNSSDTFGITNLSTAVLKTLDILSVAGGGGGGRGRGSGGGAGGFVLQSNITADANLAIVIGAGGSGANVNTLKFGANTTVSGGSVNIISVGGGGGGGGSGWGGPATPGGSGGGGIFGGYPPPVAAGSGFGFPSPTQQGFPGGVEAGGGGGAGQAGFSGDRNMPSPTIANGGGGRPSTITGANVMYAGGGGGKSQDGSSTGRPGGAGGGGASAPESPPAATTGFSGTVNSGGGGGAGNEWNASAGGNGGSGVVIIRYPWQPPAVFSNVTTLYSNVVLHGSNAVFVVNTGFANNTVLFYDTVGNITSSSFVGGNTGSFTITSNATVLSLGTISNIPSRETRIFQLRIREDSASGNIVLTSPNVTLVGNNYAQQYIEATGGTITTIDGFRIHTFNNSNTFSITNASTVLLREANILTVAGGGGGQGFNPGYFGAGGGAGGFLGQNNISLTSNSYTVTIGAGGNTGNPQGSNGSNTTITATGFTSIVAVGGGGGGGITPTGTPVGGRSGGSGGGGGGDGSITVDGGGGGFGFPSPTEQGRPGGIGCGGGGGAAEQGGPGAVYGGGGVGGTGKISSITGSPTYYAGGGGAGPYSAPNPGGAGGAGGGGDGSSANPAPSNGTVNTGGGGAGSGGSGGSGVAFIRYPWRPAAVFSNVTANVSGITEGSNAFFVVNTTFANAQTLYYDTVGNVTSSNFVGGNTGSFIITSNATVLRLETVANIPTNESRVFALRIREDSVTGNIVLISSNVILVDANTSVFIQATGGNVFTLGGYRTHIFTSSNNFAVTNAGILGGNVEYLVVGGGGSGGTGYYGGGGGAGGFVENTSLLTSGTYTITVGAGGVGTTIQTNRGGNGSNSTISSSSPTFVTITALGGGGGGSRNNDATGVDTSASGAAGGSGGGVGFSYPGTSTPQSAKGGDALQPSHPSGGFGNKGGGRASPALGDRRDGQGGGGAGAAASDDQDNDDGGVGRQSSITGTAVYYAGGGGGTYNGGAAPGAGGLGGGAPGGSNEPPVAANVNTGGGGGGGSGNNVQGSSGGSGIVIIRYPYA